MSGFGLLTLGTQSLQANQTALNVTGQNISNVNTEGYTRQKPVFQSREFYAGVEVSEVDRLADQFLNRQIWADSATHSSYDAFEDYANELDNLMASDVTSVSKAMDDYFGSLQQAVDDPVSLPNRELFIANTEALVKRFNDLDANIRRQQDTINGRLESSVSAINTIASHIAELNDDIRIAQAAGNVASEMLDQRDQQLEALSEYVSFTTIEQPTGEMSVFVGNGEPLVVGLSANSMTTLISPADTSQLNVGIVIGSNVGDITNQLSGGKIGGALDYRETILNNTLDELGRMAIVFAETMNEQHQKGMDLDGDAGGLMFSDINDSSLTGSRVLSERDNARPATGSVVINDVTQLVATEYELSFNTTDSFTLVRGSDDLRQTNESMTEVAAASDVDEDGEFFFDSANGILRLRVDGVTLSLESSEIFAPGDKFLVRPVRTGASDIESVLNNARQLALATPLAVSEHVANSGTGEVSVTVTEIEYDVLSQVPNTAVPPSVAGLEVNADEANAGTVAIQVTDPARINNLTYPLSLTHNAGDYAIVDGDGNPLGGSPFTPALGVIDLSTEFGLSITVGGVPLDGEVSQIEYDSTTINDTSLTPPVEVSFLSELQGVAYTGNDLVTAPTGVSATDVSTGMTFSSVAINNAEVAGSVDYPLTLTYNNGTGVFDIDDVNGNTLAFTGTFTGTNMTIPEIGVSIDVAAVPVFAGGEQFTLAPTTQNEVQYSPIFSAVTGQPSAAGAIDARVTDTSTVNSANYPLTVTYSSSGPDVYTVTDSTGATLLSAAPGSLDIPGIGLSLDVTGVPVVGDTFTIQPDAHTNGNANAAVTNV
ncbi:flagellar hook-associated protein FlgK, partial [Neptuniibacter sp.]|uniref:flagellar hook-associated protein FlgK n=1 Tax=Neptuniibacter sp. TaxID=1962643 RepID=UPI002613EC65